jgi:hypothetical protein
MMRLVRADLALTWRHMLLKSWHYPEHEYRLLVAEAMAGCVWAAIDGDDPVALGGLYVPRPDLPGTIWLSVIPDLGARRLLQAVLLMRRFIAAAEAAHDPGVVCCVDFGNERGARLGRALGFVPTDTCIASLQEWRRRGGGDR